MQIPTVTRVLDELCLALGRALGVTGVCAHILCSYSVCAYIWPDIKLYESHVVLLCVGIADADDSILRSEYCPRPLCKLFAENCWLSTGAARRRALHSVVPKFGPPVNSSRHELSIKDAFLPGPAG